ncbi:hypothetical protein GGD38_006121 [Chitinophagaceae bacterium OAS944]|nr:hypothetical protein [Chitinophagaceae bacterium OAS944]
MKGLTVKALQMCGGIKVLQKHTVIKTEKSIEYNGLQ